MILITIVWWALVAFAAYTALQAWGPGRALLTFFGVAFLALMMPFGLVGDLVALAVAVWVGYRAEMVQKDRRPRELPGVS